MEMEKEMKMREMGGEVSFAQKDDLPICCVPMTNCDPRSSRLELLDRKAPRLPNKSAPPSAETPSLLCKVHDLMASAVVSALGLQSVPRPPVMCLSEIPITLVHY